MVCNILSMEGLKVAMVEFKSSMEEITEIAKSPQWLKSISPWIVSVSPWGIQKYCKSPFMVNNSLGKAV